MFEESIMMTKFSAGSGIDSIESRVRQLESMIKAVDVQRQQQTSTLDKNNLQTQMSFKTYLGNMTPPPKIQAVTGSLKDQCDAIQPLVQKYASQYGVDPQLVISVIRQESGFNPNAVSKCGAQGLMQLMPTTAKNLGVSNPFDPEQNLAGGVKLLSTLLQKYQGNVALALAAYNAGGQAVARYNGIPPYQETQNYVRRILAAYLNGKRST